MFKGGDVVGKPVIAQDTGKEIHKVETLVIDPSRNQLMALVVEKGGLMGHTKVVPWQGVHTVGEDAILIHSEKMVVSVDKAPDVHAVMKKDHAFKGKKIMTTDGKDLGTIGDVFFDEKTGVIV